MKLFTLYHQDNINSTPVEIETVVTESYLQAEEKLYSQLQSTAIRYLKCSEITQDTILYAVFAKGGYIGTNNQKPKFLAFDKEIVKSNAKYRRSQLSKGEKSHFGMGYSTLPLSGKKLIEIFKTVSL